MKKYLLVRLKKRWPILPATAIAAIFWAAISTAKHDGKVVANMLLAACFALVVILFPFRWRGEHWDTD